MAAERRPISLDSGETFIMTGYSPGSNWRGEHVLLQSAGAPVELLGHVRTAEVDGMRDHYRGAPHSRALLGGDLNEVHVIVSDSVHFADPSRMRSSKYALAWRGPASGAARRSVEAAFRRTLPDVVDALDSGEESAVSWAFAEVASAMSYATTDALRRRRYIRALAIAYAALVLVTALTFYFTALRT